MTTKIPFTDRYNCSLFKRVVSVSGMTVELYDKGQRVAVEQAATRCSGSPDCGCMLKQPRCPYPADAANP